MKIKLEKKKRKEITYYQRYYTLIYQGDDKHRYLNRLSVPHYLIPLIL